MANKLLFVLGVMTFLFISLVNAESFSLDPCPDDTVITEDANNIYAESSCFSVQFPKNYGNEIIAYDKYNNKYFDLKAMQLYDEKTTNPNDHQTISFQDKPMIPSYSKDVVSYSLNDGGDDIRLFYTVKGNSFKQGIEINNWVSNWDSGNLVLRTKYHKDDFASSHFVNQPATVDGVEQGLIVESITEDQSTFYRQTLWVGKSFTNLFQDPLYTVDYTPNPSQWLDSGSVDSDSDSEFSSTTDITSDMSDNLTNVSYRVIDSGASGEAISGSWVQTYDSDYHWFLRIYKTAPENTGVVDIYAYADTDNLSTNFSSYSSIDGLGWFNLNIDNQMDYMTNVLGLSYSKIRFFSGSNSFWGEMRLRKEINDTIPPTIHNCWLDKTELGCGDEVELSCNITDNLDVDTVIYKIDGTNYTAIQYDSIYSYNFTPTGFAIEQYDWQQVYATDILDNLNTTDPNLQFNYTCTGMTITLLDKYALNSSNGRIDNFTTDNLEEIEYVVMNYSIDSNTPIDSWYFNFTAGGENGCSLGNKQSSVCYSYPDWIQFMDGTNTATYDGTQGNLGDRIIVTETGNTTNKIISLKIDEHYNPNVFKWYDALYNFSDVKWQNSTNIKIKIGQLNKIELDTTLILLDADQYKLDFRVTHNNPNNPLEAYLCNSSYTTGHADDYAGCQKVAEKNYDELQDVSKFRGVFTKNLIDALGDIKYVVLETHETDPSKYYAIKTFKAIESPYTTHWEYSYDNGSTWNNAGDGYETELNINWFYDAVDNTEFVTRMFVNTTTGLEVNLDYNISWDIDAVNNYPPIVNIFAPIDSELIQFPYNITFSLFDVNDDPLNGSLKLYKSGFLNNTLSTTLTESSTTFLWDDATPDDTYVLVLEACETNTTELYCSNFTVDMTVQNACVEDWVVQYGLCLTNDSQLKYYTDQNACGTYVSLPVDNGTYILCDYCSEDLEIVYSACYLDAGIYIRDVSWQDNNYYSCCAITSIVSDCSVDYSPYNLTTTENCTLFLESDFEITLDTQLTFGFGFGGLASDKASGKIWINDTNTTYYCLSYVKTFDGNLVQTNPPYTKRVIGLLQVMGKEIEDREFFITSNGLANIYWTNNNLVMDGRQYIFGVECAGNGQNIKSELLAQVGYDSVNAPITRWFWFKENALPIVLGMILLFIITIFIGFYIKGMLGR